MTLVGRWFDIGDMFLPKVFDELSKHCMLIWSCQTLKTFWLAFHHPTVLAAEGLRARRARLRWLAATG
jgi:hypothetical protein